MPNYAMNVNLLPLDLCKELEVVMNSFWWGSKSVVVGGFVRRSGSTYVNRRILGELASSNCILSMSLCLENRSGNFLQNHNLLLLKF